jgi:hypothetical protein
MTIQVVRLAVRRNVPVLACIAAIASGCAALLPTPQTGPTPVEPPPGTQVEVAVDNRSDEGIALTFSQNGQLGPNMILGPCEASNLIYPLQGPFTVGLGKATDLAEGPMPPLVDSSELRFVDGEYRLLVRVDADGDVSFAPLEGVAEVRSGGGC